MLCFILIYPNPLSLVVLFFLFLKGETHLAANFELIPHAEGRLQLDGTDESDVPMGTIDADLMLTRRNLWRTTRWCRRRGGGSGILGDTKVLAAMDRELGTLKILGPIEVIGLHEGLTDTGALAERTARRYRTLEDCTNGHV